MDEWKKRKGACASQRERKHKREITRYKRRTPNAKDKLTWNTLPKPPAHRRAHRGAVRARGAVDAVLVREAPVRLDDARRGHARLPLERVDVLREACVEVRVVGEELHEGVRERGAEAAWVELARQRVDCSVEMSVQMMMDGRHVVELTGKRVLPEIADLKHCFGIRKIQPLQVGLLERNVR